MWYVIWVTSGKEEEIKEQCQKRLSGDMYKDIFVLRYTRRMKKKGQWQEVTRRLFPGYIFIDTEDIDAIRERLRDIDAMTIVLGDDDKPVPISDSEQAFLQSLIDDAYVVNMSTGHIIGDEIIIASGPLAGTKGIIKKINRHKKEAEIEVDLMGNVTRARVGLEIVSKVTEEEFAKLRQESIDLEAIYEGETDQACGRETAMEDVRPVVRILSGVFKGMTGRLVLEADDEIQVEVEVYNTAVKIWIGTNEVMIKA